MAADLAAPRAAHASRSVATSRPAVELALAALTIGLIFGVGLVLPMPFWHAQPPAPAPAQTASSAPAASVGWPAALLALGFAVVLCAPLRPYVLALRLADRLKPRTLVLLTGMLALVALLIYPAYGSDLFVYLDYERLWSVYGANPLLAYPALHPEDWAYRFTWIVQQPSPYGPLWPLLTWPIAALAGDSLWGWIAGYKLLALGAYVVSIGLIWRLAEPERRLRAVLFFAWNPLVLFEVLGKAHNDALLAVSALLAIGLARRQPTGGLLAATAGMLVKLSGAALVLALAIDLARQRRWRALAVGLTVAAFLSAALYAPFWSGLVTLAPVFVQTSRIVWSPGALLVGFAAGLPRIDLVAHVIGGLAWALAVAIVARRRDPLPLTATALLLATLLLLTTAFFAHYLVPVVALVALANSPRLERLSLALCLGSLAAYSVELLAPAMPSAGWIGSSGYQVLGSLLTLAPAATLIVTDRYRASSSPRPLG